MKKFLLSVTLCVSFLTTQSYAWGEREQAALLGGVVGIVLGSSFTNSNSYDRRYDDRPVYVERQYYGERYIGGNPNWRPPVPAPRLFIEQRPYYTERYYYGR